MFPSDYSIHKANRISLFRSVVRNLAMDTLSIFTPIPILTFTFTIYYIDFLSMSGPPPFWRRKIAYPEQQLPGVPHELGAPQQPPEPDPVGSRDEALTVL
jgi:hypothetical protein